jgi:mycothiol system anti-sigma-R factor
MAHPNEHARHYELPPEPRGPSTPECREAISQLYVYLDGELTEERRVKVQHHLDHCGSCLEAFEFEAELRAVIAERARDRVPPTLLDRLAKLLRGQLGEAASE